MTFWKKIKILANIAVLMIISYIVMVFISHFSVYNKEESYKIADSFKAMIFKTDVPAEYLIYFGIHIILVVSIVIIINLIVKKRLLKTDKSKT